jgi:hypothetical protein
MPPKSAKKNKIIESTQQSVPETVTNNEAVTNENSESWRNTTTIDQPVVNTQQSTPTDQLFVNTQQSTPTDQPVVTTQQSTSTDQPVNKVGVLDYDQDFYRHLDKTSLSQFSIDDLLRVLSVRGYDNKNPALWAGARRLMQQLSCEQIAKEKKQPPYIRNAPFREQRHENQKEKRQEVQEQRQERKQVREKREYTQDNDTKQNQGFRRDKSKYNRNFEESA